MKKTMFRIAAVALVALGITNALAWNGTGHETVASIAWQNMTTEARAKASAVLRKHPRFSEDVLHGMNDNDDQDEYAFRNAATWPDIVRTASNPLHETWHKAVWHYIDFPFSVDGSPVPAAPSETFTPGQEPTNASQAIQWSAATLSAAATPAGDRAIALCWMLHLVGDIHQPLHCSTLFSADRFKTGDRGGNSFSVMEPNKEHASNLHSLWDGALGGGEPRRSDSRRIASARGALPTGAHGRPR